jgi:hypothetical protein
MYLVACDALGGGVIAVGSVATEFSKTIEGNRPLRLFGVIDRKMLEIRPNVDLLSLMINTDAVQCHG